MRRRKLICKYVGISLCSLLLIALSVLSSCDDEKPQIFLPPPTPPVNPDPPLEYIHFEAYTSDTLRIKEGETDTIEFRTAPIELPTMDNTVISFIDTLGAEYEFIEFTKPAMKIVEDTLSGCKDTTWIIVANLVYGSKNGDVITLTLREKKRDTTFYSAPMVIDIIPAQLPTNYSLERASGEVSAYESGNQATVRFRTQPWNLLLDNENSYTVTVTDTLGTNSELFTMVGVPEFQKDSTWSVSVSLNDAKSKEAVGVIKVAGPDTSMLTEPFTIMKVAFSISQIKLYNGEALNASKDNSFDFVRPAVTDFSKQRLRFSHTGDKLTLGDSLLEVKTTKYNTIDINGPTVVTLWKYDLHKDYIITMSNTNLPVVRINTPNSKSITSKEVWMENCMMRIEMPDGTVVYDDTLSVRGRGNGTWTETDKKPYALRLNKKAEVLGMHKQRRWILLANFKDYTLLRNDAALWLSKKTALDFTVSGQFVELVLNGEHRGNYYLCEQIRIDKNRVNIDDPNLDNPSEGGFLMEIDSYLGYNDYGHQKDLGFWSKTYNLPYIFKDPDEDQINKSHAAFKYIQNRVNEMESVLNNSVRVRNHEYEKYLDVQSAIDFALIQELTMNHDAYNTWPEKGPHSTYLFMDKNHTGGKFHFGPVWDFDYHTFMPECIEAGGWGSPSVDLTKKWVILNITHKTSSGRYYYSDLLKDEQFKDALVARWDELKGEFAKLPDYIDMMADSIAVSEVYNRKIWFNKTNNTQNGDRTDYETAIKRMKDGFNKRWQWIDENIHKL